MFAGLESPMHLLVILAIALIVLGPKRLPEAGRGLGAAVRNFRQAVSAPATAEPGSDGITDEHAEAWRHKHNTD